MNQETIPPKSDTKQQLAQPIHLIDPANYSAWFHAKDGFIRLADISGVIRNREPYTCIDTPYFVFMRSGDSFPLHLEDSDLLLKRLGIKASGEILSPE